VWFITQNPTDLPDSVLGQIGNRVQHALRAYTPKDQKALRAAARSFRENPAFDTEDALQALGVGEALVSVLDEKGVPSIVDKAGILPPRSSMSAAAEEEIVKLIETCPLADKYAEAEDRESAYEILEDIRAEEQAQAEEAARQAAWEKEQKEREKAFRQQAARRAPARRRADRLRKLTALSDFLQMRPPLLVLILLQFSNGRQENQEHQHGGHQWQQFFQCDHSFHSSPDGRHNVHQR